MYEVAAGQEPEPEPERTRRLYPPARIATRTTCTPFRTLAFITPPATPPQVAGSSPSRLVMIPNPHTGKDKGALTLSDTACGVGVYVSQVTNPDPDPPGCAGHAQTSAIPTHPTR